MDIVAGLITTGVIGTVLGVILAFARMANQSERRRADDWRTAAQTTAAANTVISGHVEKLIGSVEQLTASHREMVTSQREMMTLLQTVAADRRGAA